MLVAGFWGAMGGVIYWATPDRPAGATEFGKRVGVGFVAGAVTNSLGGTLPFDSAGAWDVAGVGKLIVAGFAGLAAIGAFLPDLNETYRKRIASQKASGSPTS